MPLKILIAPDKFKGTLNADAAARAIANGWQKARPEDRLECLPISDGGDGFGEAMSRLLKAKVQTIRTVDAAHRPCQSQWWWDVKTKTAIIESANVIGLAQLPSGKFHPFELDTFGLGKVLHAALKRGATRCLIGIGGSATNDGGFGLARALGWKFLDANAKEIIEWPRLIALKKIQPPPKGKWFNKLIVAVDVQNKLLGSKGCTRIYGPQKGLKPVDFPAAERALRQLACCVKDQSGIDHSSKPGAGAAGGLGFGLCSFAGATMKPGFELFAEKAGLKQRLKRIDLVITGEGSIDLSTLMGKGVGELARLCHGLKIPCIGLAGVMAQGMKKGKYFSQLAALTELVGADEAKREPSRWLEKLSGDTARKLAVTRL